MSKLGRVVAIDFEAFGTITPENGFSQLGAVLYDLDTDSIVSVFSEYASQKGYTMEQRCYDEFWSKHLSLYDDIQAKCAASSSSPYDVVEHFYQWLDKVVTPDMDCFIIIDNAAFDAGILRCFSKTRNPHYAFGPYRGIVDVSNIYYGIARVPIMKDMKESSKNMAMMGLGLSVNDLPKFPKLEEKAHSAEYDAALIAKYWSFFQHQLHMYALKQ